MKITPKMCSVIADIEKIIGSECYNLNSYDGWNDVEGCEFRYPVSLRNKAGHFLKIKGNINSTALLSKEDITPESLKYMKYKFGSNELFIGLGIIKTLEYLEDHYGINFDELDNNKG